MASTFRPPAAGFGTLDDPPLPGPAVTDDPLAVSPYLLRPLRSYAQALRDREVNRALWTPRDARPGEFTASAGRATTGIGDAARDGPRKAAAWRSTG